MPIPLETERLIIRPFDMSDVEASYQMNLDEEVSRYTGDGGVVSRQEIERRIMEDVLGDYKRYGYGRMAIELKEEHKFIGFVGLKYLADLQETDLGYRLLSKYWGRGYATEASRACLKYGFESLGLDKVIAFVLPENKASSNVLEKLGFHFVKEVVEDGELAHLYQINRL